MSFDFNDLLIETKKKKFLEIVILACKSKNLAIPQVNFEYCPEEDEDQLAHFHSIEFKICVSKRQLHKLNFEDIEETATHEVAHILELNHDSGFHKEHQELKQGIWRPPGGIVVIGNSKPSKRIKTKSEVDRTKCNYHICKKEAKLEKCTHCKRFFCLEHIKPKLAGMPRFDRKTFEIENYLDEFDKLDAHPCVPYFDYLKQKEKERKAIERAALNELLKKRPIQSDIETKFKPAFLNETTIPKKTDTEHIEQPKNSIESEHQTSKKKTNLNINELLKKILSFLKINKK